eukprot:5200274-Lingulodinium_polyedra.AAC.1
MRTLNASTRKRATARRELSARACVARAVCAVTHLSADALRKRPWRCAVAVCSCAVLLARAQCVDA